MSGVKLGGRPFDHQGYIRAAISSHPREDSEHAPRCTVASAGLYVALLHRCVGMSTLACMPCICWTTLRRSLPAVWVGGVGWL